MATWAALKGDEEKETVLQGDNRQAVDIRQFEQYKHLPVKEVRRHEQPGSWGTVVLIPQYHFNASGDAKDGINTAAAQAQEQIYDILTWLINTARIDLVMVEGELEGEVPRDKYGHLTECVENKSLLEGSVRKLLGMLSGAPVDEWLKERLKKDLKKEVSDIEREIILKGAPFKLLAEGVDFKVVGVEDEATLEAGREIIRDYVYVNDRLSRLARKNEKQTEQVRWANITRLWQLLQQNDTNSDLKELHSLAKSRGLNDVADTCKEIDSLILSLHDALRTDTKEDAPSRADNPYASVTNKRELESRLREIEKSIDEVVVDRRNKEVAKNVAEYMRISDRTTSILPFGAEHEKGLVEELKKQGLEVVVVQPASVDESSVSLD